MEQQGQHQDLIEQTLRVWQPHTDRELTLEDAREIIENISGFFHLLLTWDAGGVAQHCSDRTESQTDAGEGEQC